MNKRILKKKLDRFNDQIDAIHVDIDFGAISAEAGQVAIDAIEAEALPYRLMWMRRMRGMPGYDSAQDRLATPARSR